MKYNEIYIHPSLCSLCKISVLSAVKRGSATILSFLLLFLYANISINCFSQQAEFSERISSIAQELAEKESDPEEMERLAVRLSELYENPVRINSGDTREISRLFFLTDFQIKCISDYVTGTGPVLSLNELPLIPGLNQSVAGMMTPFITLGQSGERPVRSQLRQRLITTLGMKPGGNDPSWAGPPWKGITRYRAEAGRIEGGFTAEKDQGERLFTGNSPIPDFFSAHVSYESDGIIKNLIAGDYSMKFGYGVAINTTLRSTLYLTTPGSLSGAETIRPYTSTDENNFFRGAAATIGTARARMTLFFSSNKIDATLMSAGDSAYPVIGSLYRSGYHNTLSTVDKKDVVTENAAGINLSFDIGNLRSGLLFTSGHFSVPFFSDTLKHEAIYVISGGWNPLLSAYYKFITGRFIISGEAAANEPAGMAFIQGLEARPSDRININMVFRYSSPSYFAVHGKFPGVSSGSFSGNGFFANFSFEMARNLFLSAGADLIHYRWISYRSSSPSLSLGKEVKLQYLPPSGLIIESLFTYRSRSYDEPVETGIPPQAEHGYSSARIKVTYPFNEKLRIVSRIDIKQSFPGNSKGFLLLQDLSYTSGNRPVSIWLRYSIFNTGSYDSGIYTWENDVLNSYSVPVLYGNGCRFCLMASWKPIRSTEVRFRYSLTLKNEGTSSVRFPELKLQVRILI